MENNIQKETSLGSNNLVFAVNTISGICAMPFWDGIYERIVNLDSIKDLYKTLKILHEGGHEKEALRTIFVLFDLTEKDYPEELDFIIQDDGLVALFIEEFLVDTEDLINEYE